MVIRQGVSIGDGFVIGAGSIVTHDVPENSIAYGAPARVMKERFPEEHWIRIKDSHYYMCITKEAKHFIDDLER